MTKDYLLKPKNVANVFGYNKDTKDFLAGGSTSFCSSATFENADPDRSFYSNVVTSKGGTSWVGSITDENSDLAHYFYDYPKSLADGETRDVDPKKAKEYVTVVEKPLNYNPRSNSPVR